MPFEELETVRKDNMPPAALLSYMRQVRKGKEMDRGKIKPKLIVTIPTVICVSKCEKFIVQVGTGADKGKMRIVGVKKGVPGKNAVRGTVFKTAIIMRFGHVPRFGDEIFDGVRCSIVRRDDDTYEITLPDDFSLADEAPVALPLRKSA
jgi:hypothetical protein